MSSSPESAPKQVPVGVTLVGVFLTLAAAIAFVAGGTLLWPGSKLDRIWALNPHAYERLQPFGRIVGLPFLLLSAILAAAAAGWHRRRLWGWWLTVAIIATELLGDAANAFAGNFAAGAAGLAIGGALLIYLLRPAVRAAFSD